MQIKFSVPNFDAHEITEVREYSKYFDETVNVYNSHYNSIFYFNIQFDFNARKGRLEIPNCGGHVDSVPSSFRQHDWTISKLKNISAQQTWATNWDILNRESYISFTDALFADNAVLNVLRYQVDAAGLDVVLKYVYHNDLLLKNILVIDEKCYTMFEIDPVLNERLRDLSQEIQSRHDYLEDLCKILKTDRILINSKLYVGIKMDNQ